MSKRARPTDEGPATPEAALDAEELERNFAKIQAQRKALPVWEARSAFLRAFAGTDTLILTGETGCGKTTQIPQFLLGAGYGASGDIGVTQPRRVAAMSVARRVAAEMGEEVGESCGYVVRFDERVSAKTRLRYMTDGMLLRESIDVPNLSRYSVIVVDEAHERSLHTDMMLALLKRAQKHRNGKKAMRPLKLIVMSATLDTSTFCTYFGGAPAVQVLGRQFPVSILYAHEPPSMPLASPEPLHASRQPRALPPLANPESFHAHCTSLTCSLARSVVALTCSLARTMVSGDYLEATTTAVMQIHTEESMPGDVLVFLPGQEDIDAIANALRQRCAQLEAARAPTPHTPTAAANDDMAGRRSGGPASSDSPPPPPMEIHPLYAALPTALQMRALQPSAAGTRKVILATNIAETSLTIDGVTYVVDTGLAKVRTLHYLRAPVATRASHPHHPPH